MNESTFATQIYASYDIRGITSGAISESFDLQKQISQTDKRLFIKTMQYDNNRVMKYETYDDILKNEEYGWYDLITSMFSSVYSKIYLDYVKVDTAPTQHLTHLLTSTEMKEFLDTTYTSLLESFYAFNFGAKNTKQLHRDNLNDLSLRFDCFIHHLMTYNVDYKDDDIFKYLFENNEILDKKPLYHFNDLSIIYNQLIALCKDDVNFMEYANFLIAKKNIKGLTSSNYLSQQSATTIEDTLFANDVNREILNDLFITYVDFNLNKPEPDQSGSYSYNRKIRTILSIMLMIKLDSYCHHVYFSYTSGNTLINSLLTTKYNITNPYIYTLDDVKALFTTVNYGG